MNLIMKKILFKLIITTIFLNMFNIAYGELNYFENAKNLFKKEKFEESKFLLEKNIVYNPKHSSSYLYLAKIYKQNNNEEEQIKNLNTTLLIDPKNEEALYLLIDLYVGKSNFNKVDELLEKFSLICVKLCSKRKNIDEKIKNLEPKKES